MNKTLYLRDEDGPIWDRARELAGDKLSPYIVRILKDFIVEMEAKAKGLERITIEYRDAEDSQIPKVKAFYGRWIIPREEAYGSIVHPTFDEPDYRQCFAVAQSAKGSLVIYRWSTTPELENKWDEHFWIFESVAVAAANWNVGAVALEAYERMGVPVEELDI